MPSVLKAKGFTCLRALAFIVSNASRLPKVIGPCSCARCRVLSYKTSHRCLRLLLGSRLSTLTLIFPERRSKAVYPSALRRRTSKFCKAFSFTLIDDLRCSLHVGFSATFVLPICDDCALVQTETGDSVPLVIAQFLYPNLSLCYKQVGPSLVASLLCTSHDGLPLPPRVACSLRSFAVLKECYLCRFREYAATS